MCWALLTTLQGPTRMWYSRLKPYSISSFNQMVKEFKSNFLASVKPKSSTAAFLELSKKDEEFFWSLIERPPTTVTEMLQCANQYMDIEALVVGKREDYKRPRTEKSRGHPSETIRRRHNQLESSYSRPPPPLLNSTWTKIFLQIKAKGLFRTPNSLKGPRELQDCAKYYRFHRDYGPDTEDCLTLAIR
ncbi:hypothetical protein B296_00037488 [Ensete ventricosum]|uniref:Retrotransposon gag domain-containing protein n=1 Tax=Ensete ventricosum TaxID=4639 RepID=A0A426XKT5_ENSVE|nr:hypothetical protein B296_00037488 [Ensete ventricosum]